MNKLFSLLLTIFVGSSIAYASPKALFKAPETSETPNITICIINENDAQVETDEALNPGKEAKRVLPHLPKKNPYQGTTTDQELIRKEILRSMFEPISYVQ